MEYPVFSDRRCALPGADLQRAAVGVRGRERIRRLSADPDDNYTYIITEPRVGYRMEAGEAAAGE